MKKQQDLHLILQIIIVIILVIIVGLGSWIIYNQTQVLDTQKSGDKNNTPREHRLENRNTNPAENR